MTSDRGLSANKGEWSEFYTFCYLLNAGILKTADEYLNPNKAAFLPIIKIIRDENGLNKEYYPDSEKKTITIFINGEPIKSVPRKEFETTISMLYLRMKEGMTNSPEFQQAMKDFMANIHCTKIKAKSSEKEDIVIQLHDTITNQTPIQGFSIKSYIGNKPTLLNAGRTTNFVFRIKGCDEKLMNSVNAVETNQKIVDRIQMILDSHCSLEFAGMESDCFRKNLQKADSLMPQIIAEMLRVHYTTGKNRLSEITYQLEETDPLGMSNPGFYVVKIKSFLCSVALGMIPSKPWNGVEDANGGYIVVKEDGDVVCFFLYDRNVFEEYLLNCTIFERASTSRHGYLNIYQSGKEFLMNLNLQIRFTKPSKYLGGVTLESF